MAEDQKPDTGQGLDLNLDGDDNAAFEELGIDIDQINKEVSQISPQKVELDTTGLDLDFEDEVEPAADAAELEEEPGEEDPVPETGRPPWFWALVLGGSGVVAALVVAVVGYFTWWAPKPEVQEVQEKKAVTVVQELPAGVPLLALEEFSVPLKTGKQTLLRISLHLALTSEAAKANLLGQAVKVRDTVYGTLLERSQDELKTAEQRLALRQALVSGLNRIFQGRPVREVYFTQFLIL